MEPKFQSEPLAAILFYGGRLYRLGHNDGLELNRNRNLEPSQLHDLAIEMAILARQYVAQMLYEHPADGQFSGDIEADLKRVEEVLTSLRVVA